jgi:hypothetical protein
MANTMRSIFDLLKPFLYLMVISVTVPLIIKFDVINLGSDIPEVSLTEFTQHVLLFCTVLIFSLSAKKLPQQRGFYVLVAGFFGCMLLREHDYYFDIINHGFWFYPTIILALASIFYTCKNSDNFIASALQFKKTNAYIYIVIGLTIVLIFSRLFGTSGLWQIIMKSDYQRDYKTIVQEGLELFGYAIVFLGSIYQLVNINSFKKVNHSK